MAGSATASWCPLRPVSALSADVWSDLIASIITSAPVFIVSHVLLRRHVTRVAKAQTRDLKGDAGDDRPA